MAPFVLGPHNLSKMPMACTRAAGGERSLFAFFEPGYNTLTPSGRGDFEECFNRREMGHR
jgi:hypothetical protein